MSVFVDTSALLALLDADDSEHHRARKALESLRSKDEVLVSTNYVLVETVALIQHRLGFEAVRAFQEDVVPLLIVEWTGERGHQAGMTGLLMGSRKKLSLVDCVSFDAMRRLGIRSAFAFDRHFREQGFECIP